MHDIIGSFRASSEIFKMGNYQFWNIKPFDHYSRVEFQVHITGAWLDMALVLINEQTANWKTEKTCFGT